MLSDTNENKEPLMEIFLFLEVMFFIIIDFHTKEPTLHTFYLQVTSHKGKDSINIGRGMNIHFTLSLVSPKSILRIPCLLMQPMSNKPFHNIFLA